MYKKVELTNGFVGMEKEIMENVWKARNVIQKSFDMNQDGEYFTFYDGPPTANGKPHVGHILTRVMKDIIPRYKVMKGYKVIRKAGWDTHGLPVELEIEKKLGISGKEQIEEYGVEKFVHECKDSVFTYVNMWEKMTNQIGYWVDMDNPYVTYHNPYIESVWWALKQMWDKDLLYKGHKVMPYCPRCGTALSSHEVSQGYKDVKDLTAIAKFKVVGEENKYFLAWTTTPWTLPGYSSGDALQAVADLVKQLPGYQIAYTGVSYQERQSAGQAAPLYAISILVVFLCLAALYESWSIPIAVILVVPMGVIGAIGLTALRGMNNDIYFQVGLITTIGLVSKNAILIVEFAKELHDKGEDIVHAAVDAVRLRLRPIVMTSMAFGLGVLPLALASGAGSGAQNAIGWGVLGGMITGTFLCVLFVPIFYVGVMRIAGTANERKIDVASIVETTKMEAEAFKEGKITYYEEGEEGRLKEKTAQNDNETVKHDKKGN